MRRPLSSVVRQSGTRTAQAGAGTRRSRKYTGLYLVAGLILVSTLLAACSNPFGGAQATPTPSTRALSKIAWCTKTPLMVFRDENAITPTPSPTTTATATATSTPTAGPGTPTTITNWSVVKANLGFETYLPTTLPNGTCLVSAQATIHDPILGGSFTIGYLFSDHTSLSLSEAPLLKSQGNVAFQCNPTGLTTTPTPGSSKSTPVATSTATATVAPSQLCIGSKGSTSITIAGAGTVAHLQQIFSNLQANVNWIPA